jgi:hypothetical protein
MDRYLSIELDSYGFTLSTAQFYTSISWLGLGIGFVALIAYKVIRARRAVR